MEGRRYHVLIQFSDHNGRNYAPGSIWEVTLVKNLDYTQRKKELAGNINAYLAAGVIESEATMLLRRFEEHYGHVESIVFHSNTRTDRFQQMEKAGKEFNIAVTRKRATRKGQNPEDGE